MQDPPANLSMAGIVNEGCTPLRPAYAQSLLNYTLQGNLTLDVASANTTRKVQPRLFAALMFPCMPCPACLTGARCCLLYHALRLCVQRVLLRHHCACAHQLALRTCMHPPAVTQFLEWTSTLWLFDQWLDFLLFLLQECKMSYQFITTFCCPCKAATSLCLPTVP